MGELVAPLVLVAEQRREAFDDESGSDASSSLSTDSGITDSSPLWSNDSLCHVFAAVAESVADVCGDAAFSLEEAAGAADGRPGFNKFFQRISQLTGKKVANKIFRNRAEAIGI